MTLHLSSFRDPAGSLEVHQERVLRRIYPEGQSNLEAFLTFYEALPPEKKRWLVETKATADPTLFEHKKVFFPSYPYEWAPSMLYEAALLTLKLSEELLLSGKGLKDASAYNVLFEGSKPVFIDILSVEARAENDPLWYAEGQFIRSFLNPLLAYKQLKIPPRTVFSLQRDGLSSEELWHRLSWTSKWGKAGRKLVLYPFLAGRLAKTPKLYQQYRVKNPELAAFILRRLYKRQLKLLKTLRPTLVRSHWSSYQESLPSYDEQSGAIKKRALTDFLQDKKPPTLLDIGANTGDYSLMAARLGTNVVAIDSDDSVIDQLFRTASSENLPLQPLVVDITRPSPSLGWNYAENLSFLDRARHRFDTVLMLALIHHLLVTERIPLIQIAELASTLSKNYLVIEFVAKNDPLFQQLLRGRGALFERYTESAFAEAFKPYFSVENKIVCSPTRILYFFKKRAF